jgi:hypothetical protein
VHVIKKYHCCTELTLIYNIFNCIFLYEHNMNKLYNNSENSSITLKNVITIVTSFMTVHNYCLKNNIHVTNIHKDHTASSIPQLQDGCPSKVIYVSRYFQIISISTNESPLLCQHSPPIITIT